MRRSIFLPAARPGVAVMTLIACPVCGSPALKPGWAIGDCGLSRCERCRHLFVSSHPTPVGPDQAYERDYCEDVAGVSGPCPALGRLSGQCGAAPARLRLAASRPGPPRRLAWPAVGPPLRGQPVRQGGGRCRLGYRRRRAFGLGDQLPRRHDGLTIVDGSADNCAGFRQRLDLVTIWDVPEYLEDPGAVLLQVAHWLKPGGVLALNTVDSASHGARLADEHGLYLAPPYHLQHCTRDALLHLFRACGFQLLAVHGQDVMWGAARRREHLGGLRAVTEEVAAQWRARPPANSLHRLVDFEIVAVREVAVPSARWILGASKAVGTARASCACQPRLEGQRRQCGVSLQGQCRAIGPTRT